MNSFRDSRCNDASTDKWIQALANGGVYEEGYIIDSITDNAGNVIYKHESNSVRIYSEATASIMNDMMRSVINEKSLHHSKMSSQA